jgi:DNA mismatch repair protein MutS2
MPFRVSEQTLALLEWPELVSRLGAHLRTPRARAGLDELGVSLFAPSLSEARERIAETREAKAILDDGDVTPAAGVRDIEALLPRLARGGALSGAELLELAATLRACAEAARFLARRAEAAPQLAAIASALADHSALAAQIEHAITPGGDVSDAASPALANARRAARELAVAAKERIERFLGDSEIAPALQDSFVTLRGDRYVLPVKAGARDRVPGIVHDASASGTTFFVEPEAVVELNNRKKQADLTVERETRRVLSELSEAASRRAPEIDANLAALARLDLAFARAGLAIEQDASEPTLDEGGVFALELLRHPLLALREVVPNDLRLGDGFHVLVISGPNAGGKTIAMKALALAALAARAGMFVPAAAGARVAALEHVVALVGDAQDLHENLSTFSAHIAQLAQIVAEADATTLAVLDEVGVGTDPSEGAALAQACLEALADAGARTIATTHYNLLKELADVDPRFENASVEFDPQTLAPTYRLRLGMAGASSATAVAARMGRPARVIERARALIDREDRRLDQLLSELQASRAALERERREATQLREESEQTRDAYREKLEKLQERRDKLIADMRSELDAAFKSAHGEIAGVIRDLQRRGSAQEAARARERLVALEQDAKQREQAERARVPREASAGVDWARAKPGDAVRALGGKSGTLVALPDRSGRALVQIGSARIAIDADKLRPVATANAAPPARGYVRVDTLPEHANARRVDLRGMRVDEAIDAVERALDDAARAGSEALEIIHGVGTGALQSAIREHLRRLPHVARFTPGASKGGEGVTLAYLK